MVDEPGRQFYVPVPDGEARGLWAGMRYDLPRGGVQYKLASTSKVGRPGRGEPQGGDVCVRARAQGLEVRGRGRRCRVEWAWSSSRAMPWAGPLTSCPWRPPLPSPAGPAFPVAPPPLPCTTTHPHPRTTNRPPPQLT